MKKIYVAGAYSDNNVLGVLKNIGRGEEYAAKLFMLGFAPFTPWHDKDFVVKHWREKFTVEMFYNYSIEWLLCSDAVFIVPDCNGLRDHSESAGTIEEIRIAVENKIPVFYHLHDLIEHYTD